MQNQIVTIYCRLNGDLFLHAHDKTTMGIALARPPFLIILPDQIERVTEAVMSLLYSDQNIVPHPTIFNQLNPLFALAKCRDWKEFAHKTSCFHVQLNEGAIWIIPTKKVGAGFKHLPEEIVICNAETLPVHLSVCLLASAPKVRVTKHNPGKPPSG